MKTCWVCRSSAEQYRELVLSFFLLRLTRLDMAAGEQHSILCRELASQHSPFLPGSK